MSFKDETKMEQNFYLSWALGVESVAKLGRIKVIKKTHTNIEINSSLGKFKMKITKSYLLHRNQFLQLRVEVLQGNNHHKQKSKNYYLNATSC